MVTCSLPRPFGDAAAGLFPQHAHLIADRVESKRDEVHGQQQVGQSLVPVPEVVCQIISVIFQYVKRFIFDLPACSGTVGQSDDVAAFGFD